MLKIQEKGPTGGEALYSHNSWIIFSWIKDIKLVTKLFCHLAGLIRYALF